MGQPTSTETTALVPRFASRVVSLLGVVIALLITSGGLFIVFHFCTLPVFEYTETLSWRETVGKVTKLSLRHHHFDCYVTFSYTVDGQPYIGNHTRTIGHHNHFEDHGHIALCNRLNHSSSVAVWYNPSEPQESALKVSFVGDFWLAMHAFDSLALVALGGAVIFWVTGVESAIFALSGAHSALVAISCVPVSAIRISRGYMTAFGPLFFGAGCAILAVSCLYQLGCCPKSFDARNDTEDTWWTIDDVEASKKIIDEPKHFFVVDDDPSPVIVPPPPPPTEGNNRV